VEVVLDDDTYPLEGRGPWTVGRSQENDIVVPDPNVSRRHARLSRADNGFVVEDLGSTNGTLLDGAPIDRERIESGDELTFGQITARFVRRIDSSGEPPPGGSSAPRGR
jgi:pSer/pThr/pTyr-binding forkhead associated (FHA) protein